MTPEEFAKEMFSGKNNAFELKFTVKPKGQESDPITGRTRFAARVSILVPHTGQELEIATTPFEVETKEVEGANASMAYAIGSHAVLASKQDLAELIYEGLTKQDFPDPEDTDTPVP